MTLANTSTTVTFASATSSIGTSIALELDEEYNVDANGDVITEFPLLRGEAFVLVFCDTTYQMHTNGDSVRRINSRVPVEVEEQLTFDRTNEKALSRLPIGNVSYEWVGVEPSNPRVTFSEKRAITPSQTTIGVLKCTYKALADRWSLKYSRNANPNDAIIEEDTIIVVGLIDADTKASLNVTFKEDESAGSGATSWVLSVKDFCSDSEIEYVSVWVDGVFVGTTDANGLLPLGVLASGTHTLQMTKTDYVDSDLDTLNNDTFEIP